MRAGFAVMRSLFGAAVAAIVVWLLAVPAQAAKPEPWQLGFQEPATPIMRQIDWLHDILLVIIFAIAALVFGLLIYCLVRFNARVNPEPSATTHNTVIEVLWTIVPILILMVIAVPSGKLLYAQRVLPKADLTIKATGNQWHWNYTYPDHGGFSFDSNMVEDGDLKPGQPRLLTVDNEVVVPVNKVVRVIVTAEAVIHNWAVPAFGIKMDAVPGRLNETWFKAEKTGLFYGQCSELCGIRHAFMPIAVRVVTQAEFETWLKEAKTKFAGQRQTGPRLAQVSKRH